MSMSDSLNREDPIKHLRNHKGKSLIQTVTDLDMFNKLCGAKASKRLASIMKKNKDCIVQKIGHTAYVYH